MFAAVPNRTDRVDHPFGGQLVTFGDFGFAGHTAVEIAAFLQQLRTGGTVNGAVNSPAAQQSFVGGVHDRIHLELGDVALNDFNARLLHFSPAVVKNMRILIKISKEVKIEESQNRISGDHFNERNDCSHT